MLVLTLLLQAAMPAAPPTSPLPITAPVTPQGEETVALFTSLCMETALDPAPAHQLLDSQPAAARAMTTDELARVMPGATATDGWILKSPHDAWAALWFAPARRTCGVTVRAAEPAGMETALNGRLQRFYGGLGFLVAQKPDEVAIENGVTVHRASWTVTAGAHELAVIASFADHPMAAHQHLMTFTMLR